MTVSGEFSQYGIFLVNTTEEWIIQAKAVTSFIQSQKKVIKKWTCGLLMEYFTLRLKLRTDAFSSIAAFTQHDQEKWLVFWNESPSRYHHFWMKINLYLWVIVIDFVPPPHPIFYVWHCCTVSIFITHQHLFENGAFSFLVANYTER